MCNLQFLDLSTEQTVAGRRSFVSSDCQFHRQHRAFPKRSGALPEFPAVRVDIDRVKFLDCRIAVVLVFSGQQIADEDPLTPTCRPNQFVVCIECRFKPASLIGEGFARGKDEDHDGQGEPKGGHAGQFPKCHCDLSESGDRCIAEQLE